MDETSTEDAVDSVEEDVAVAVASPTYFRSRLLVLTALRVPKVATDEAEDELMTLVVLALTLLLLLAVEGSKLRATSSGGPTRAVDAVTVAARSCAMARGRGCGEIGRAHV